MDTQTSSKSLHPLAWVAGIALILFSAVGVAAFMGWLPSANGDAHDKAALEQHSANTVAPAPAPVPVTRHAAPVRHTSPVQSASPAPSRYERHCSECGVIESVQEIQTKGQGSGLGAVGGGVVGGLLGNQVGGGHGKDAMTVVGAIGGAMAGNEVEKRVKSATSYATTVRFDDGSSRVISEANLPTWRAGDKVKVIDGVIRSDY